MATGSPVITGTAQVGETLSADLSGISDADGITTTTFTYLWYANDGTDDTAIEDATGSTYTLVADDAGKTITVQVLFTDGFGYNEVVTSAPTATVTGGTDDGGRGAPTPPVTDGTDKAESNNAATGAPTITGTTQVGETLTASAAGISDADGLSNATFGYQWLADDVELSGATSSSYTLVTIDTGKSIKVSVSFTDDAGNVESLTSTATETVAPPLTASVQNVPSSHDGGSAFTFELRFSEEPKESFSYRTLRDEAFTVTDGQVIKARRLNPPSNIGWEITVQPSTNTGLTVDLPVTTDCAGQGAICTEEGGKLSGGLQFTVPGPLPVLGTPNTPATGLPTITGTAQVGETLTADTTGISDDDGLNNAAFAYQWLAADTEINGATASTYTLVAEDAGKAIKVQVSFTDDGGNDEILTSAVTGAVSAAPPPPNTPATGVPTITGIAQVGETLTVETSGISDPDGMGNATFIYQWTAGGTDIEGATGSSYTIAEADEGLIIHARVSFTDDARNHEALTSEGTEVVTSTESENPVEPPLAPQNLVGTVNSDGSITLTWEAPSDDSITGYRILRRRPTEGEDTLLVYVADTQSTATTYTDTNPTAGVQHAYRVRAINAAGAGPVSNFVNVTP